MTTPEGTTLPAGPASGAPSLHPGRPPAPEVERLAASVRGVSPGSVDVDALIAWAVEVGPSLPLPGAGSTAQRWEMLAAVAAVDVAAARLLEPHADALAILAEARADGVVVEVDPDASWGVFAAEGPGMRLTATRRDDGSWRLEGTKPWCSLAGRLGHALVTAWTGPEVRRLFALDLRAPGVSPRSGPWVARGLPQVVSAPIDLDGAAAVPVGDDGWYLRRAGFAWGGLGVAAVWWGAALPLVDALVERAGRSDADQLAALHAGTALAAAWSMRAVLAEAAELVDAGHPSPAALAATVRVVVHDGARRIRELAVSSLGPAPLTADEAYARRVADLETYLGQHHGDRDTARLARRSR